MLLAIDVGNTNLVLALGDEAGSIEARWRIETADITSAAACEAALRDGLGDAAARVDDTIIASVVPDVTPRLKAAILAVTGVLPMIVGAPDVDLGIAVHIDNPAQAGADRLVNAVGAMAHHKLPAILLDFGTATTLDLVAEDGSYEGGIIAPGVALSIEALERAAAQLPRLELRPFGADLPVLGKNTVAAMETGVLWGYVGMIEGLLRRLRDEQGGASRLPAIATGGLAALFADHLPGIDAVDPDLTIRGLFEIHARNREKRRAKGS
jgi:type III pantothenate kinase